MASDCRRIRQLPLELRAQIRSTAQISSLADVVLGLVTNALDAGAEKISVHLDFSKGFCSVLDNGHGILGEEFEDQNVAQLYYTSKDVGSRFSHGRYGRFLSALSNLSLLSVVSSYESETSVSTAIFKNGVRIACDLNTDDQDLGGTRHGTRVTVRSLFANIPVRVKHSLARFERHSELDMEFSALRIRLVGLVIASTRPFSLNVTEDKHRYVHKSFQFPEKIKDDDFDLGYVVSCMFQAGLLDSPDPGVWRKVSLCTSKVSARVAIRLQPSPSQSVQFLSLNHRPVPLDLSATLLDPINSLFEASNFGTDEAAVDSKDGTSRLSARTARPSHGKRQMHRWPMFYANICLEDGTHLEESSHIIVNDLIVSINAVLYTLMTEFLQSNGYRKHERKMKRDTHTRPIKQGQSDLDSTLNKWSRIKSGNSIPKDLLSGLPFMTTTENASTSTQHEQANPIHDENAGSSCVPWTNPRTGTVLCLNSSTGMVVPSNTTDASSLVALARTTRRLNDVTSSLETFMLPKRFETPLMSIVPDSNFNSGPQHDTKFPEDTHHITGPSSLESIHSTIGKAGLGTARVLGQVDRKFILASISRNEAHCMLVAIDQHAADERIRVEELFRKICDEKPVALSEPITFPITQREVQLFDQRLSFFRAWGVEYETSNRHLRVLRLPDMIVERCRLDPKLVINLLRTQIWLDHVPLREEKRSHWLDQIAACPRGILDMLISRACRSAIMFNDELTIEQCQDLVQRLGKCSFPFQCAHGRPSLTILAQFRDTGMTEKAETMGSNFSEGWKAWVSQPD